MSAIDELIRDQSNPAVGYWTIRDAILELDARLRVQEGLELHKKQFDAVVAVEARLQQRCIDLDERLKAVEVAVAALRTMAKSEVPVDPKGKVVTVEQLGQHEK